MVAIVLVLLGDVLSSAYQQAQLDMGIFSPETLSVGDLFVGALIPGLMLVGLYLIYIAFIAYTKPNAMPAMEISDEENNAPVLQAVFKSLLPPLFLIIAVLGSIIGGLATPTEAAGVGAVGSLMLAGLRFNEGRGQAIIIGGVGLVIMLILANVFDLRMSRNEIPTTDLIAIIAAFGCVGLLLWGLGTSLKRVLETTMDGSRDPILYEVMRTTMEISAMVFVILIGAGVFSLVFRGLGGDDLVHEILANLPGGKWGAILVVMVVMFFLGFILDFIEITFVVVPIVAPVLLRMDIDPVWLGIMMAMNLQTSFLTPPFGFALFYLRGVAPPSVTTGDIYRGVMPFVAIQIIGLLLLAMFPALATWLPKVVFN